MLIIPAIDLKDGRCVRLVKGDFATAHKVADNALKTAQSFCDSGAALIHMVDLDGALSGNPKNREKIIEAAKNVNSGIQTGGGIRDIETVRDYLENGVARVVLGSAAVENKLFLKQAADEYGDRIV